ncbi:hypothetical protein [Isoptericola aurantiacus]|uniref:hypothetical protein n=1 Tax=Isoptericola aurantiacus TaxID=3377839 RepID=UPI003839F3CA
MTVSLKERLAAKARRTVTVPVQVSDPGPARAAYEKAEKDLLFAELAKSGQKGTAKQVATAKRTRDAASAELRDHFAEVEFAAGDPADVERILAAHTDDEGEWSIDALPELAALCATDPELQDAPWWSDQVGPGTTWSLGERQDLWIRLLNLNTNLPPEQLPKD